MLCFLCLSLLLRHLRYLDGDNKKHWIATNIHHFVDRFIIIGFSYHYFIDTFACRTWLSFNTSYRINAIGGKKTSAIINDWKKWSTKKFSIKMELIPIVYNLHCSRLLQCRIFFMFLSYCFVFFFKLFTHSIMNAGNE